MGAYIQQVSSLVDTPTTNELVFLPTGLGQMQVIDHVINAALRTRTALKPHVVFCAVRPGQVLSQATRLREIGLGAEVGAYCGGDFLYDFAKEFKEKDVLVITAGLLMRLVKLGVYSLERAKLLVLHDAIYTTRNHPMNTLVREYYWKIPSEERPKILGTLAPQLHALSRPFDKLRQSVRKLAHSLQAGIALPAGHALEGLSARIHRSGLVFEAYETYPEEQDLIMATVRHFLALWDVLFKFNLNPFGRLIHFPKTEDDVLVNPFQHDWEQVELMVLHSMEYCDSRMGKMIMQHVQKCVDAVLVTMSGGHQAGMSVMCPAVKDFLLEVASHTEEEAAIVNEIRASVESANIEKHIKECSFGGFEAMGSLPPPSSRQKVLASLLQKVNARGTLVCVVARHEMEAYELRRACLASGVSQEDQSIVWTNGALALSAGTVFVTEHSMVFESARRELLRTCCSHVIWFSPRSVIHASGFDMDSNALTVMRQMCGVADSGDLPGIPGPRCHIIATSSQVLQWVDISKADQQLLAASEFVVAGDASLEEGLLQLRTKGASSMSEHLLPSPSSLLHTLCCGMCGIPPSFNVYATPGELWQAEATLAVTEEEASFVGQGVSAQEARDASALRALSFLTTSGLITAYWKTTALDNSVKGGRVLDTHFLSTDCGMGGKSPFNLSGPKFSAQSASERLICSVCGIATTSEAHLMEHQKGRRHKKNVERCVIGAVGGVVAWHPPPSIYASSHSHSVQFIPQIDPAAWRPCAQRRAPPGAERDHAPQGPTTGQSGGHAQHHRRPTEHALGRGADEFPRAPAPTALGPLASAQLDFLTPRLKLKPM